ncbi:CgeB family protein [Paenibacillus daejeonensis]|uniref:CgeB family protein n=1 Tax=Paenibacillus daejeonensis TaxID=135193 RepID=UPI00037965C2|nr:glycosyltransferase [Paenibacillus daejeonensis]
MKILFTNPAPIIKYGMQPGFEKHGWTTDRLEVPEQTEQGLRRKIDTFKPDYIFTESGVTHREMIFPVLEQMSIPHIYWAIEDPVANDGMAMEWAARSVLSLTPCQEMMPNYRRQGYRVICIPFAIDPDYYFRQPVDSQLASLDAVHIGNNYNVFAPRIAAYRYIIQPFIDHSANIAVYGMDWCNPAHAYSIPAEVHKGYLAHERTGSMYSSAKMVLGLHSIVDSVTMQSMRTFEVLGCGGFLLTQKTKAIEAMFENHKHLVWSASYEETVELMNYYLPRDEARATIAAQGMQHVHTHHTYERRAAEIIGALS